MNLGEEDRRECCLDSKPQKHSCANGKGRGNCEKNRAETRGGDGSRARDGTGWRQNKVAAR